MKPSKPIKLPVNIHKLVHDAMAETRMSTVDLARELGIGNSSVHYLLKRHGLQVGRLWTICEATGVNIFRQLANAIDINNPVDKEKEQLKKEIEDLKKEREILRDVISLMKK
ncbi:helix-turn-helix domain-containing protein [Marinifilum flexuosum]|uniref:helix-turn-helix domain-containing protein n=1 Tax=Marinifilum flexuosum TaxID=1117708 RepID=UPI00248F8310|nr:helix-turn-helix domain-containing protein [Marinifilum flexuosum]